MVCEVPTKQSSTDLSWSFGKLSLLPVLAHHPEAPTEHEAAAVGGAGGKCQSPPYPQGHHLATPSRERRERDVFGGICNFLPPQGDFPAPPPASSRSPGAAGELSHLNNKVLWGGRAAQINLLMGAAVADVCSAPKAPAPHDSHRARA